MRNSVKTGYAILQSTFYPSKVSVRRPLRVWPDMSQRLVDVPGSHGLAKPDGKAGRRGNMKLT